MNRSELNQTLKRTNIKGRDYIDVAQRIDGFWQLYPDGSIVTEKEHDDGQRCDFKATAYDGERILATGHAYEEKKGMVNSTSYVENCETSAVGRCLGILGIGSADSVASVEEVQNAIARQEAARGLTEKQKELAREMSALIRAGRDKDELNRWIAETWGKPREMSDGQCEAAIAALKGEGVEP